MKNITPPIQLTSERSLLFTTESVNTLFATLIISIYDHRTIFIGILNAAASATQRHQIQFSHSSVHREFYSFNYQLKFNFFPCQKLQYQKKKKKLCKIYNVFCSRSALNGISLQNKKSCAENHVDHCATDQHKQQTADKKIYMLLIRSFIVYSLLSVVVVGISSCSLCAFCLFEFFSRLFAGVVVASYCRIQTDD